jgi:glycosyltransferase involved in cell wall biosynthesis
MTNGFPPNDNLDKEALKRVEDVDVLFFSAFDHNEGTNNHGLFQMFDFFRDHLRIKSIYVNTLESIYSNNEDVFDISILGDGPRLGQQVSPAFASNIDPRSWIAKSESSEKYMEYAANVLIDTLPNHKFFALSDKADINLGILELVMSHFNSKLIILSAVNNTWTGFCSYPDEFNCDKFKSEQGCCEPCPATYSKQNFNPNFVAANYAITKRFVEDNIDSIYLNVGNSFSYKEACESSLFKNVKKVLIPLQNIYPEESFEQLCEIKKQSKDKVSSFFIDKGLDLKNIDFIMMWSAYEVDMKRKGMDYFLSSLRILKYLLKEKSDRVLLIICGEKSEGIQKILSEDINLSTLFTGNIKRDPYNMFLAASDVYCSTTLSDAGPRTTYESAALATPVISFDKCNAADFVNESNGALVDTYDVKKFAEELYRFANYNAEERKAASLNMYETYTDLMNTDSLVRRWEAFFDEYLEQ